MPYSKRPLRAFTVAATGGASFTVQATNHTDALALLQRDPFAPQLPENGVIGVEGPGKSGATGRFYRKKGTAMYRISASAAAVEAHLVEP